MKSTEKITLNLIKQKISEHAPDAKVYLYGSRARNAKLSKESDWDLLILLKKENLSTADELDIIGALYELEFELGQIISPLVFNENDWHSRYSVTPFYKVVMQEGILI